MTHSNKTRNSVINLRKKGLSINNIAKRLNLSRSTVSIWTRNTTLSSTIKKNLIKNSSLGIKKGHITLKKQKIKQNDMIKGEARKTVSTINLNNKIKCQTLAAIIYWCEGEKHNPSSVRLANSDPNLVKTYLHCLRKGFNIKEDRLHALIHLHDYHNENTQKNFWSKITKIPLKQFNKSYIKPHTGIRKRKNYQGCISIRYGEAIVAKKLSAIYHALADNIGP